MTQWERKVQKCTRKWMLSYIQCVSSGPPVDWAPSLHGEPINCPLHFPFRTHISAKFSLCFSPFIYFPFLVLASPSFHPLPLCTLHRLYLCHLPRTSTQNLPFFSFLSLSCYKIHSVRIFHLSVFHCLYQCCSLSVCRLSARVWIDLFLWKEK